MIFGGTRRKNPPRDDHKTKTSPSFEAGALDEYHEPRLGGTRPTLPSLYLLSSMYTEIMSDFLPLCFCCLQIFTDCCRRGVLRYRRQRREEEERQRQQEYAQEQAEAAPYEKALAILAKAKEKKKYEPPPLDDMTGVQ